MPLIKFTDTTGGVPESFQPIPAKFAIPKWLKELSPYFSVNESDVKPGFQIFNDAETNQTAKRCLPMVDAVMAGYVLPLTYDINISEVDGFPNFEWRGGMGVGFHSPKQISTHSFVSLNQNIPKILNPWAIETPSGYSCLFISHLNSDDKIIEPFAGIVDTDRYFAPVHFPFLLKKGWTGLLEAGSPVVQVIPFKRESWTMEIHSGETPKILKSANTVFTTFRNAYRKTAWKRKDFS